MKVGLIDVDSHNFPNLALMKISAYHKKQGDTVEWYQPLISGHMDKVYKSKVFTFTDDYLYPIDADEVIEGGTGYDIEIFNGVEKFNKNKANSLPYEIEHIMPDYSIYNITDTAYGFLSRGCPRGCSFCHVADKEGRGSYKVADLKEFWNGQKNIVLLDPNILACKEWKTLFNQLIDSKAWIDFNQGLDIRLMDKKKAEMLSKIKTKSLHFAWDRYSEKEKILPKFKMFRDLTSINERNLVVYVLCNYDTTIEQDLERIYTLRDIGYYAYVMLYNKESIPRGHKLRKMARWVNNRFIFSKCERFEDYID